MLSRLATRGWPVVYSNGPLSLWERGSESWNESPFFSGVEDIALPEGGMVTRDRPGRSLPIWPKFPAWSRFVAKQHVDRLLKVANNPPPERRIAMVCYPSLWRLAKELPARGRYLHVFDAWQDNEGWSAENQADLADMTAHSDLITTLTASMARKLPGTGPERAKVLPHGVTAEKIMAALDRPCPDDLAAIPHPRIGYFGRLSQKIDIGLMAEIAERKPDWNLVFVGAVVGLDESEPDRLAWEKCRSHKNVHVLGFKDSEDVPAYMCNMDVNLLPFKARGEGYWNSVFSLKTYEYLATGKPVVGASIEHIRSHSDVIAVASSAEEWISAIDDAVNRGGVGTVEHRQKLAQENSWESRVDLLEEWLSETFLQDQPAKA